MAIASDKANVTIDFEWQNDDTGETFYVKHHYIEGTPTVSFSNDGNEWTQMPFVFYAEIVQYINSQKGGRSIPQPPAQQKRSSYKTTVTPGSEAGTVAVAVQTEDVPQTGLPLPMIQRQMDANGTLEPMEVADMQPLESFANLQSLVAKTSSGKPRKKKAEEEVIINRPVIRGADEATAAMLRGGNSEKSIRPRHANG